MGKNKKKTKKKEEIAEDWCFVCKDGGLLLVCEHKGCLKAYHPSCVGKDDTFLETGNHWICEWHFCDICHRIPNFHCYCCTTSLCRRCSSATEFAYVRGKKGFCSNCLRLVQLIEDNMDVDSDGERVDFKDRETFEGLFKEYYDIIKEEEGFTTEDIHSANAQLKKGRTHKSGSDSDEFNVDQENELMSDNDDVYEHEEHRKDNKKKRCKKLGSLMKVQVKSNRKEFIGWGSKSLIEFLRSIGKDTSAKLTQYDVTSIIKEYIKENNLFDPKKKRKIICDARLLSVFRRKTVNRQRIYDLLEDHFTENQEELEEEELGSSANDEDENVPVACRGPRKSSKESDPPKKNIKLSIPEICFASIIPENIKHVYLKRSLVLELAKQSETFDDKIIGSFVRVKSNPSDFSQRNSHQLVQVTDVKRTMDTESMTNILLQVSDMPKDIFINMLSDNNFSEEECEVLRQQVKRGLLKKPTIVDFEQKARSLHEDITKHWIAKELVLLQNLIDLANEKGWRRELFEYLERKRMLQIPSEQLRLLQNLPTIIPDLAEIEQSSENNINGKYVEEGSPKLDCIGGPEISRDKVDAHGMFSVAEEKGNHGGVIVEDEQHTTETSVPKEPLQHSHVALDWSSDDDDRMNSVSRKNKFKDTPSDE